MPTIVGCLMILLLVIAGNSGNIYIQARRKEPSGISTLLIDNQFVSDPKGKAIALSNQFQSVFTREDLSNVPTLEANISTQAMPSISFNVSRIESILSNLNPNKAHGPDGILPYNYT